MDISQLVGNNSYSVRLVGTANYQEELTKIVGEDSSRSYPVKVYLIEENDNPHDDQAIRAEIDNLKVGYLSRSNAKNYRSLLSCFKRTGWIISLNGLIVGGWDSDANYGVRIDFPQIL